MKHRGWIFKRDRGFTVIELAVAMATIVILAALAVPTIINWLPNYRLRRAATDMHSNFQRARLEAIKMNCNCAVNFNQAVTGTVFDYIVFLDIDNDMEYRGDLTADAVDNDNDGTIDEADEVETIIAQVLWSNYRDVDFDTAQGGGDGLTFTNNDDGLPSVAFRRNGLPRNNGGGLGMGSVFLINTNDTRRSIVLNSAGRVRVQ